MWVPFDGLSDFLAQDDVFLLSVHGLNTVYSHDNGYSIIRRVGNEVSIFETDFADSQIAQQHAIDF